MVTIQNAENALKSVYLGVIANQLNTKANPLLAKIKQTDSNIWGKDIIKLAPFGINGGIGAGTETGALPTAAGNNYVQFKTALKNLFGRIEISDKAVRASSNAGGAFVNLLADEMEGLVKASTFNLGRMVYGDGTGLLAEVATEASAESTSIVVDDTRNLIEGMVVDIFDTEGNVVVSGKRITYVDRQTKTVYLGIISKVVPQGAKLYVQGSKDNEITGLEAIFGNGNLYGLNRTDYPWLKPYVNNASVPMDDVTLQTTIDAIEDKAGSEVDFIACSRGARKAYQQYLTYYRRNIDVAELAGGFKAITFNGIPVVADRFIKEGTAYFLNTKDFALHELCDWQWLEGEDGKILKQNPGFPSYTATLVKYADLICDRPLGQAKLSNISGTISNPYAEIITAIEAKA
ncbi:MAG: phage major capsid protein [Clostridia bacterium]|nr:phage major capsid protein [Clostridia bacterium]